jgi:hypothetical protein
MSIIGFWQRDDPLDQQELAELEAQKIDTI